MDKKKITAALAAVAMVMKTREEALACSALEIPEPEPEASILSQAARPFNVWGVSGRQTHMQANAMMQLRMFK